MLKITEECSSGITTIRLEGKLVGPWVEELERAWLAVPRRPLTVDMRGVTTVDQSGKSLLAKMSTQGATFLADMPMTKYIIEHLTDGSNGSKNGSRKGK
jgi:hypothetical protein